MSRCRAFTWLPPVAPGGPDVFAQGSTAPLRFTLVGLNDQPVLGASATLQIHYASPGAPPLEPATLSLAEGDRGTRCREFGRGCYGFDLSTRNQDPRHPQWLPNWTYLVEITLDDGQTFGLTLCLR